MIISDNKNFTVWLTKVNEPYSLFTLYINKIFTNLITIFVLAQLAPYFPFPLIIMSIHVMESFRRLLQLMKILQYDLQKLMSLQSIYITYQEIFFTNLITIFVLARLAPYFPFHLIILSISVMESFVRLMQLMKIWQYDLQKLMSLQSIYITHYIVY